jgi:enoyl-CoA hydratase/carnithine racemase
MHTEYRWVLAQAERDPAVRAVVITGAGRAFCAGADAKALEGHAAKGHYDPGTPTELAKPGFGIRPEFDADFAHHFGLSKPVVAARHGSPQGSPRDPRRFRARVHPGAKFTTARMKT